MKRRFLLPFIIIFLLITAGCKGADSSVQGGSAPPDLSLEKPSEAEDLPTDTTYTITYSFGSLPENAKPEITSLTQTVVYNGSFTLYEPSCKGFIFQCWQISGTETEFHSGVYTLKSDVSLTAVWLQDSEDDFWWGVVV
ncbi:MAG: hypothetical protein ACI4SH_06280 [Candidatus Scatosoma sp.]